MAGLLYNFDIIEQPDAQSFIFKDLTGNYAQTNTGGWGTPNTLKEPVEDYYNITITFEKYVNAINNEVGETIVYTLTTNPNGTNYYDIDDMLTTGVEIFKNRDNDGGTFEDGGYKVTVKIVQNNTGDVIANDIERNFGFYALTKAACMNDFITYNPFLPRKDKEIFWEKARLLDNLYYACETDQILHFRENLDSINRLK